MWVIFAARTLQKIADYILIKYFYRRHCGKTANMPARGGYSTKFYMGRLRPEV